MGGGGESHSHIEATGVRTDASNQGPTISGNFLEKRAGCHWVTDPEKGVSGFEIAQSNLNTFFYI